MQLTLTLAQGHILKLCTQQLVEARYYADVTTADLDVLAKHRLIKQVLAGCWTATEVGKYAYRLFEQTPIQPDSEVVVISLPDNTSSIHWQVTGLKVHKAGDHIFEVSTNASAKRLCDLLNTVDADRAALRKLRETVALGQDVLSDGLVQQGEMQS